MNRLRSWWLHLTAATLMLCMTPHLAHAALDYEEVVYGRYTISVDGGGNSTVDNYNVGLNKPVGATVFKAFALTTTTPNQVDPGIAALTININGTIVTPDLDNISTSDVNITPNTVISRWGDVTPALSASLNAAADGAIAVNVRENAANGALDGSALFVIWNDPSAPVSVVGLKLGAESVGVSTEFSISTRPLNTADPLFDAEIGLGISYSSGTASQLSRLFFENTLITSSAGGFDDGLLSNGALWTIGGEGDTPDRNDNDERYNVTDLIAPQEVSLDIRLEDVGGSVDDYVFSMWFQARASGNIAINTPLDGSSFPTEPTYNGFGISGTTVTLTWVDTTTGATVTTMTTVDAQGDWSASTQGLPEGTYTLTASAPSPVIITTDEVTFTIDATIPVVTIATPGDGTSTADTTPTLSGTGEPGADVVLILVNAMGNTVETLTVTPDMAGDWSVDAAVLAEGQYVVTATSTDAAGNIAVPVSNTFTVDTTAPSVALDAPVDNSLTNDSTPTVGGTSEAGSVVTVSVFDDQGVLVQAVPVVSDAAGNFNGDVPVALADGTYTVVATSTDLAGNSVSDTHTVTIDTIAPLVVVVTPADGSSTNDDTPTISGLTNTPGPVTVTVTDAQGMVVFTDLVPSNMAGNYTVDTTSLPEGTYTVTASSTDAAGNTGTAPLVTFSVDTTAPNVAVTAPADGSSTNDDTPSIAGTTDTGSAVMVVVLNDQGNVVFSGMAIPTNGVYAIDTTSLPEGTYTVNASSTDAAGNTGNAVPTTFIVDTTAPSVALDAPVDNSLTNDTTPTVSGTSEAGSVVTVNVFDAQGVLVQAVPVVSDAAGSFNGDVPVALADGTYTVVATSTDLAGNSVSDTHTVTVDTTAPVVAVTAPVDGSSTNDDTPSIAGTTDTPGAVTVTVTDDQGNVVFTGMVTPDANGVFSVDSTVLPEGTYTVDASSVDEAGNTGNAPTTTFSVDTTAPVVTIDAPSDNEILNVRDVAVSGTSDAGQEVIVELQDAQGMVVATLPATTDANGAWTVTFQGLSNGDYVANASVTDPAMNSATDTVSFSVDSDDPNLTVENPEADATLADATPTINGTTDPDSVITVIITDAQGNVVETLTVTPDASGAWTTEPTQDLADGPYTVSTTATRPNGLTTTIDRDITIDTVDPTVVVTSPVDGSTTNETAVVVTGTTEPNASVLVTVTDANDMVVFTETVIADDQGNFSADAGDLTNGEFTVDAVATDAAGNTSEAQSTFTIDTTAPTLTISSPVAGDALEDTTPTITGTADAGAEVEVFVDGVSVGTVTADDQGQWSFDVTDPLAEGEHTVEAKTSNAAGTDASTGEVDFTVATPGDDVVITSPTEGSEVTGPSVVVTGTGTPGEEVTVTIGGQTQTVVVDDNGDWTTTVTDVPSGDTTITATSGGKTSTVDVTVIDPALGVADDLLLVGGACGGSSTTGTSSPASGLVWLLVCVGGVFGYRRRRRR